MRFKNPIVVTLLSLFVVLVVNFAVPQDQFIHTIISSVLVFYWMAIIFVIGSPKLRSLYQEKLMIHPLFNLVLITLLPFLLIFVGGGTTGDGIVPFIIWYIIPACLLILPEIAKKYGYKYLNSKLGQTLLYVLGAGMLWIGFDHRHTTILFDNWEDMGYLMNSFWMASVGMATFGLYRGIKVEKNELDLGLLPSKYGGLIANVYTLLASVVVISFGLLTGFLEWNPLEFDFFNVVIGFVGIYLTIALQEELIFRGILFKETSSHFEENSMMYYLMLILTTMAFAFTHWNNEQPEFVYHYFFAAFISGLAYVYSYKKAGMYSAMLSHTLVDWVWSLLLKRV
jgi:membrane protease YdiL (CAAX protease family)